MNMDEKGVINRTKTPATKRSIMRDLSNLGVTSGMTLLAHSSLSALGWVCGGPVAVILALEETLGPGGTLVMPTHSTDLSDPSEWRNPPVPKAWWKIIRENMPAYDPDLTLAWGVGVMPECFRKQKGVLRSMHPQVSFAAYGSKATTIVGDHSLDYGLGEGSPLARIYDLAGWVLLIGVGHESNTSLHLAEYRATYPSKRLIKQRAPIVIVGHREWVEFQDIKLDDSDFEVIGEHFAKKTKLTRCGHVAQATSILMPQRPLVDYAVRWIEKNRR